MLVVFSGCSFLSPSPFFLYYPLLFFLRPPPALYIGDEDTSLPSKVLQKYDALAPSSSCTVNRVLFSLIFPVDN